MSEFRLRPITPDDRDELAELVCLSTNHWYQVNRGITIFPGGEEITAVFPDVYQALDPGCGVAAEHARTGRLIGSCFVHPRPTHVSLGILNVHPNHFRKGIARAMLQHVIEFADRQSKPVRLVSSAMSLESYSLYTRAGFVPRQMFQDVMVEVPEQGLSAAVEGRNRVRDAVPEDVTAMAALEHELIGIRREQDFRYFLANDDGFWHVSVVEGEAGRIDGFMGSSAHPGCNMIGPGTARNEQQAAALVAAELDRHRGRRPVMLLPVECADLVRQVYAWGGRNSEMHLWQVRGHCPPIQGVSMPTFLPESA